MQLPFKKKLEFLKTKLSLETKLEKQKENTIHELSRLVIIIMGGLIIMEVIWKM